MPKRNNFTRLRMALGVATVALLGLTYTGVAMSSHPDSTQSNGSLSTASGSISRYEEDEVDSEARLSPSASEPNSVTISPATQSSPEFFFQQRQVQTLPRVHARTRAS